MLYARYPMVQREVVEDCVQTALVDLLDYWVNLPSSVDPDNPQRNFAFAKRRGFHTAQSFLHQEFRRSNQEVPSLFPGEYGDEIGGYSGTNSGGEFLSGTGIVSIEDLPNGDRNPVEDEVVDAEDRHRVSAAIASLSQEQIDRWFGGFISGESVREDARRNGISHQAAHTRRQRGLALLKGVVHEPQPA